VTGAADTAAGWRRLLDVRPGEGARLGWGALTILCLMSAYYVLRPLRDAMRVEGGVEHLQWLFTGTLLAMLAANPLYAALVRRLPARRFIPLVYLFFIANLALFGWAMAATEGVALRWVGRAFFIWVSVFNLFVVSVFWALMVDVFDGAQARRLFGFLAAAATVGAMLGSGFVASQARRMPPSMLLLASALLLAGAIVCVGRVMRDGDRARAAGHGISGHDEGGEEASGRGAVGRGASSQKSAESGADAGGFAHDQRIGGSIWAGLQRTMRSPYLLNISLYILLYTVTSTFLYFQQAAIARDYFPDTVSRTRFFASMDFAVNVLTLLMQLFVTGRVLRVLGVTVAAAALPVLTLAGFGALAAWPAMAVLVVFQVLRRVGNFGLAKPTREVLFTVLDREDKYKAKNVLDTVVYRLGDQVGSWTYAGLAAAGLGVVGVALVALPLAAGWIANGVWLGRRLREREAEKPVR